VARKVAPPKEVGTHTHPDDRRVGLPSAEVQPMVAPADLDPIRVAFERRNRDLDPQLVWRGKDELDWSDLVVAAPPLFVQEYVDPKFLINDLKRQTQAADPQGLLFPDYYDFLGAGPATDNPTFTNHQNWSNRMILGDSLQVMASLAEREGLRGQVQCIYLDPPYGIKFNSNFQWSTTSRDVKDGHIGHITREPEQVKAFRDTWRDGIHSYLTYLRDRLTVARDLLTDSGSIFVQIGDENVHRVRSVMDEVFGDENFVVLITVQKTGAQPSELLAGVADYIIWYAKEITHIKSRLLYRPKEQGIGHGSGGRYTLKDADDRWYRHTILTSSRPPGSFPVKFAGRTYVPHGRYWTTGELGFAKLIKAGR